MKQELFEFDRKITGKKPNFRPQKEGNNFYRILLYLGLILAGVWVLLGYERGQMKSPFDPTPTPTRVAESYFMEAEAYFESGKLDDPKNNVANSGLPPVNDAIEAYKAALDSDPNNAEAWAELARIQVYSSSMLRNDSETLARLEEALRSAEKAVTLAPDDSTMHAIRAFALDWYASNSLAPQKKRQEALVEAEREASRALQLDREDPLALAFYAEILADQQKWLQAEKYAEQAVQLGRDLMDTHRVYGYVLETLAKYNSAIEQYQRAAEITPNLTFLYVRIGINFREAIQQPERALEYFDRAAKINAQLGVNNPLPYLEIAKTYSQKGEFFVAMRNAEKALEFDSTNASTYGQLGIIFIRARNYEGAVPLLKCAVKGCTAIENEMGKATVQGLEMSNLTVAYYYVEYGTVLAFLSRPGDNYCPEALPVLNQVLESYPDDPFLTAIAEDSIGICRRLEGQMNPALLPPAVTPVRTPVGTTTPPANDAPLENPTPDESTPQP